MADFEPRMDKWHSHDTESWGMHLKDAIFNKGRVDSLHRGAVKRAKKMQRRKERRAWFWGTWLGRLIWWAWTWFWRILLLVIAFHILRVVFDTADIMGAVFG